MFFKKKQNVIIKFIPSQIKKRLTFHTHKVEKKYHQIKLTNVFWYPSPRWSSSSITSGVSIAWIVYLGCGTVSCSISFIFSTIFPQINFHFYFYFLKYTAPLKHAYTFKPLYLVFLITAKKSNNSKSSDSSLK